MELLDKQPDQPLLPPAEPQLLLEENTRRFNRLLLLPLVLIAGIVGFYAYRYYVLRQPVTLPLVNQTYVPPSVAPAASVLPSPSIAPVVANADQLIAYVRNPHPDDAGKPSQVWLLDPADNQETKLDLEVGLFAYKYIHSPILLYQPSGKLGELRLRNLSTGLEQVIAPLHHPDPEAAVNYSVQNLYNLSPDGKYLVFQADFYKPCPSPSPFLSGFQGGWGPCQPDETLDMPIGAYLYDVAANVAKPIPGFSRVSRWDPKNGKLYFISDQNTKLLDLKTFTVTQVHATPHFGYFVYPLLQTSQLAVMEGATGDQSGTSSFGKITLQDLKGGVTKNVDSAPGWAQIQPFISSSPDEKYIYFERSTTIQGIMRLSLNQYELATSTLKKMFPEDSSLSYDFYGDWLDTHTFVTSVTEVKEGPNQNANKYLVKIDLDTGVVTRLTSSSPVYRFNSF